MLLHKLLLLILGAASVSGGRFDTGLFENFDVTKTIFLDEVKLIQNLKDVKAKLEEQKKIFQAELTTLERSLGEDSSASQEGSPAEVDHEEYMLFPTNAFHTLSGSLLARVNLVGGVQLHNEVKTLLNSSKELEKEFPTANPTQAVEEALKGIMLLKDTYQLDVEKLSRGVIEFGGKTFTSNWQLSVQDLCNLAVTSAGFGWFDTAVVFVREAVKKGKAEKLYEAQDQDTKEIVAAVERARKEIVNAHNNLLRSRRTPLDRDHRIFPYIIDEDMQRSRKQPKFVKKIPAYTRNPKNYLEYVSGELLNEADRRVCREELVGENVTRQMPQQCHLLHHDDPYLRLGPIKVEYQLTNPFRMVFHDILSEEEIAFMIDYAHPRLSRARVVDAPNRGIRRNEMDVKKVRVVAKTVQCWLQDKEYNETFVINSPNDIRAPNDLYSYTVKLPIMYRLAKKLEIFTRLRVNTRFGSTLFQVTNYGLSGLVESHIDPHGYIEGAVVPPERKGLFASGDMIATFMAWLDDVEAGGYTAYDCVGYEQAIKPRRGSAAFWIDLDRKGHKELRSSHSGCPVLKGSKWILNKWIYYFDQWHNWKCGLNPRDEFKPFSHKY